jgi:hypothetical protein
MKLSPSHEFLSTETPSLNENSDFDSLWDLDELEEEAVKFCDPLFSLEAQNKRTVSFEYWKELELDEAAADEPDEEPDGPLLAWLELLLEDWLDEPDDCSWLTIKPLIPLPPAHSNFTSPALL